MVGDSDYRDSPEEVCEDSLQDRCLGVSNDLRARCFVVGITVAAPTSSLGNLPRPRSFRLAPHGPLNDLLPLDLANKSTCREDDSSDGRIFKLLGDELELSASLLYLVEEYSNPVYY